MRISDWSSDVCSSDFPIRDRSQNAADYRSAFQRASNNPLWDALEAPSGERFPWDDESNYLQPPPFAAMRDQSLLGRYTAYPLMIVGDRKSTRLNSSH